MQHARILDGEVLDRRVRVVELPVEVRKRASGGATTESKRPGERRGDRPALNRRSGSSALRTCQTGAVAVLAENQPHRDIAPVPCGPPAGPRTCRGRSESRWEGRPMTSPPRRGCRSGLISCARRCQYALCWLARRSRYAAPCSTSSKAGTIAAAAHDLRGDLRDRRSRSTIDQGGAISLSPSEESRDDLGRPHAPPQPAVHVAWPSRSLEAPVPLAKRKHRVRSADQTSGCAAIPASGRRRGTFCSPPRAAARLLPARRRGGPDGPARQADATPFYGGLWTVLMLEPWHRRHADAGASASGPSAIQARGLTWQRARATRAWPRVPWGDSSPGSGPSRWPAWPRARS